MLPVRGRSAASSATSPAGVCPVKRVRMPSGPVTIKALAWQIVWVRCARAVRLATISARIASTWPPRQPGAVAAGALDADQVHGAEPAQPGQQPGIAVRGSGELLHPEQPADPVQ